MKGTALNGLRYEPMFPYFADRANTGAFKVRARKRCFLSSCKREGGEWRGDWVVNARLLAHQPERWGT